MAKTSFRRLCESVLDGHFAPCPPAFGLPLYLRKMPAQHAPGLAHLDGLLKPPIVAAEMVCLPQRSKGGARRAGDMSGGGYAMSVAGSDVTLRNQARCQRWQTQHR